MCTVVPDEPKYGDRIVVRSGKNRGAVDGDRVVIRILAYGTAVRKPEAEVSRVIGSIWDPSCDAEAVIISYKIPTEFPRPVLQEAASIPDRVLEEELAGRADLRQELTITIDGDHTKDFDDAITIKKIGNLYDLKVSIANVSNYVKVDTNMFTDAIRRGTSVYIPGSSIPMLPRELSNGICSLNPNVERLALSFVMEIDNRGKVVNFDVHESIIESKLKMTYKNVNKVLEEGVIPEGYENFKEELLLLQKIAHDLRRKRENRGAIDFDMKENKINVDKDGNPVSITLRYRGEAEKLIEDFMVETGAQSSLFLDKFQEKDSENTHVYRNHDKPNEDKINKFISYLGSLGHKKLAACVKELKPQEIQMLLNNLKQTKEFPVLERELLKCMAKAVYATNKGGHFALAYDSYCQTTSPIRRSGDLLNHILIKENIYANQKVTIKHELANLANVASETERNAAECEKEACKMKTAEYMMGHIGDEYDGIITGMSKYGMYVELPNLVEGMVKIDSLGSENFEFDARKFIFRGRTSGKVFKLGDKVRIKVIHADKMNKTIDFELLDDTLCKVKKIGKFDR
jgi:ribonuclease R